MRHLISLVGVSFRNIVQARRLRDVFGCKTTGASTVITGCLLAFFSSVSEAQISMPDNAQLNAFGNGWVCSRGYRQSGNECVRVTMPDNAQLNAFGSGWVCRNGFKNVGGTCKKMTPEEAEQQRIQIQMLAARARAASREFYVDDEKFTLSEISRKCEVYRHSDNYGDVECSGSKFRVIQRKCEAYFSGKYEKSGELECRGSDLRPIERYCSTSMYSDQYGDIEC